MSYRPHLLLAWGGSLGANEIWSNSCRFTANTEDLAELQGIALDQIDEIAAEVKTYVANPLARYQSPARLEWVKFNAIRPDGKYWDQGATNAVYFTGSDIVGGGGGVGPFQLAMCVTLRTFQQRGRAHSGRWYVPCGDVGIDSSTGQTTIAIANGIRDAAAAFLNAVNDNPGLDTKSVAAAIVSGVGDPGPTQLITGVQVGRVPDTQRRRRNALLEDYTDVAPVTGQ